MFGSMQQHTDILLPCLFKAPSACAFNVYVLYDSSLHTLQLIWLASMCWALDDTRYGKTRESWNKTLCEMIRVSPLLDYVSGVVMKRWILRNRSLSICTCMCAAYTHLWICLCGVMDAAWFTRFYWVDRHLAGCPTIRCFRYKDFLHVTNFTLYCTRNIPVVFVLVWCW